MNFLLSKIFVSRIYYSYVSTFFFCIFNYA